MTGRKKTKKIRKPESKLARTKKELAEEYGGGKKPVRVGLAVKIAKTKKKSVREILRKKEISNESVQEYTVKEKEKKADNKAYPREIDQGRIDREKRLIMWSGVTFFMILVGFFWLYNTRAVFERTKIESNGSEESINWDELAENIGENIEKMKEGLESIKEVSEEAQASLSSGEEGASSSASEVAGVATTTPATVDEEKIEALKKKLENMSN